MRSGNGAPLSSLPGLAGAPGGRANLLALVLKVHTDEIADQEHPELTTGKWRMLVWSIMPMANR